MELMILYFNLFFFAVNGLIMIFILNKLKEIKWEREALRDFILRVNNALKVTPIKRRQFLRRIK